LRKALPFKEEPKDEPNFRRIVPPDAFDYHDAGLYLIRSIWMLLQGLDQMLTRHDAHCPILLHNM